MPYSHECLPDCPICKFGTVIRTVAIWTISAVAVVLLLDYLFFQVKS